MGTIREGEAAQARFVLRNDGTEPLTIYRAQPTCASCTGAFLDRQYVPPGESAVLTVEIEAKGLSGEFARYIVIESSDPENKLVTVMAGGTAVPEFSVQPDELDFGEAVSGSARAIELNIMKNFGGDLELLGLSSAPPWLDVALPGERTIPEGKPLTLSVGLKPDLPPDAYDGELRLQVNGQVRRELAVPATVQVVSPVRLAEADIFFGTVPVGESRSKMVPLILAEGIQLEDLKIECEAPYLKGQLVPGSEGVQPCIKLTLLPTDAPGPFTASLSIRADFGPAEVAFEATCFGIRAR